MSRERDLKRLKKSLYQTQDILNDLITETSAEMEQKWDETRKDTGKRLEKAGKRFEKNYDQARTSLENILKETSKDVGKKYEKSRSDAEDTYAKTRKEAEQTIASTRKDAEKAYAKTRNQVKNNYEEARVEARKRLDELKANATSKTHDLRHRAADLLQGVAAGLLSARNKLEPQNRLALRNEKEKHHLGKMGYFKRFVALAVVIISKKDQLLNLGQQIYHKLQDRNAQQEFKNEVREQVDTMRRLIRAYANGHYREFPYMSLITIVAAVLYFVSVVDLVPDFIPILGLTDDLMVLTWAFNSVKDDLQRFVDWEAANEYRREKMEGQKTGTKTTAVADREAATPAPTPTPGSRTASGVGVQTGANSAASAGTTTGRTNTGGGTTSSGAGSTGGSAAPNAATGGSTSTGGGGATTSSNSNKGTSGTGKSEGGGASNNK
jgi:uncharacterized membrane protein YkvA (DUF1232 family)/ElaB/YqjD/DUF883 family membrane-anchored ribosome-binding protein